MGEQVQRHSFLDVLRIEDQFLQKPGVLLDRRQQPIEPRRSAPDGSHLEGLEGNFQLVPGSTIVKPLPETIAFSQIGQSPAKWLLPPAHAGLDETKLGRRRAEGTPIEQVAGFTTGHGGGFIPGVPLKPESLHAVDLDRFPISHGPRAGLPDRDDPRSGGHRA